MEQEDGGVRIGVGLRMRPWLSGGSGRGTDVMTDEFWEAGIMDRADGGVKAHGGVEFWGEALCGGGAVSRGGVVEGVESEAVTEDRIVREGGDMGRVRCVCGGGAVFTVTVMGEIIFFGGATSGTDKFEGKACFCDEASV